MLSFIWKTGRIVEVSIRRKYHKEGYVDGLVRAKAWVLSVHLVECPSRSKGCISVLYDQGFKFRLENLYYLVDRTTS
jgi:hypothetical protein